MINEYDTPGTPVSSINKTDRHDMTEILLKVALSTIKPNQTTWYSNPQGIFGDSDCVRKV